MRSNLKERTKRRKRLASKQTNEKKPDYKTKQGTTIKNGNREKQTTKNSCRARVEIGWNEWRLNEKAKLKSAHKEGKNCYPKKYKML